MVRSATSDQRQGGRYLIVGKAIISTGNAEYRAELVNVGSAGMLAYCDDALPLAERVVVQFLVQDYPLEVKVRGRIVHTAVGLIGIGFLEEPEPLNELLLWLEAASLDCPS